MVFAGNPKRSEKTRTDRAFFFRIDLMRVGGIGDRISVMLSSISPRCQARISFSDRMTDRPTSVDFFRVRFALAFMAQIPILSCRSRANGLASLRQFTS